MTYITPAQVRAARILLGWSAGELASRAGIGTATVSRLETSPDPLEASRLTVRAIQDALEIAGVVFLDRDGGGRRGIGVILVQKE